MSVGKCSSASTVRNEKCMPSEQKWGWKTPAWMHRTVIFIHNELQCTRVMHLASMCVPGNQTHDLDLFMARWALGTEAGMTSTPWASLSLNSASVFSFCVSSHQFTSCRIKPLMNTKAARVHYHSCDPGFRESLNSCCSGRTHCNKARLL